MCGHLRSRETRGTTTGGWQSGRSGGYRLVRTPDHGQRSAVQAGGHVLLLCGLGVTDEQDAGKQRADERTRTTALISLRASCSTAERGPQTFP
jgi:hypothetical protein